MTRSAIFDAIIWSYLPHFATRDTIPITVVSVRKGMILASLSEDSFQVSALCGGERGSLHLADSAKDRIVAWKTAERRHHRRWQRLHSSLVSDEVDGQHVAMVDRLAAIARYHCAANYEAS